MNKIIIFLGIIMLACPLLTLTIQNNQQSYEISLEEIKSFRSLEISTEREKDGEVKNDTWQGSSLLDVLSKYSITDFARLQVIASDNYMVRYEQDEITDQSPILAYNRNGEDLSVEYLRLIAPEKRDMFWIRDIARILVEADTKLFRPEVIYIAENLLSAKPLRPDPHPFEDVEGYFCKDLLEGIFPMLEGEFMLIAKDGVRHSLDYNNYLAEAVLIFDEGNYALQSPQMPAGMWIKDLAYIQQDETAVLFVDQFTDWSLVKEFLNCQDEAQVTAVSAERSAVILFSEPYTSSQLKGFERLEW